MAKLLVKILCFIAINAMMIIGHIYIFQSLYPGAVFITLFIHVFLLIIFPYTKTFTMKKQTLTLLLAAVVISQLSSCTGCNRTKPNYEGVLMTNYGRDGINDFKAVTGTQGILGPGSELYQVPMWEQKADPTEVGITTKDAGYFTVDPQYTYQAIRGKGVNIIFSYKHVGFDDADMMDKIEEQILNPIVINSYREEARSFTTDSLMTNLNQFENNVEARLKTEFEKKYFAVNSLSSGLKPPKSMSEAIEKRNNAIQQAEQVKNELQVAQMQLEKAKIDAERDKIQSTGLTKEVLTQQWIEAIRNTNNKVIITDGTTPVILGK